MTSPGSESMACNKRGKVNVGDLYSSQKDRVVVNKV